MDKNLNISTKNTNNRITVSSDSSAHYANLSKDWAVSENLIQNEDYSSKYYAAKAKQAFSDVQEACYIILNDEGFKQVAADFAGDKAIITCSENIEAIKNAKENVQTVQQCVENVNLKAEIVEQKSQEFSTEASTAIDQISSLKTASIQIINQAESSALNSIQSASDNFSNRDLSNITETAKSSIIEIASSIPSSGGSWGSIEGDINNQTDLMEILNTKADVSSGGGSSEFYVIKQKTGFASNISYRVWSNGFLEQWGIQNWNKMGGTTGTVRLDYPYEYNERNVSDVPVGIVYEAYKILLTPYFSNTIENTNMNRFAWVSNIKNDRFEATVSGMEDLELGDWMVNWYTAGQMDSKYFEENFVS